MGKPLRVSSFDGGVTGKGLAFRRQPVSYSVGNKSGLRPQDELQFHHQAPIACSARRMRRAICLHRRRADCRLPGGGRFGQSRRAPPQKSAAAEPGAEREWTRRAAQQRDLRAPDRATGSTTIGTQRAFPNLIFRSQPVSMQQVPGDSSRWFVVEKSGFVRVFANTQGVRGHPRISSTLPRASRCRAPNAACSAWRFTPISPRLRSCICRTPASRRQVLDGPDSLLSEFTSRDGGLTLDPASERVILRINKRSAHHHGGRIAFGPDGFLYFGIG